MSQKQLKQIKLFECVVLTLNDKRSMEVYNIANCCAQFVLYISLYNKLDAPAL